MYDSNTGMPAENDLHENVVKRLECTSILAQWHKGHSRAFPAVNRDEMEHWLVPSYETNRFRVLLWLQHDSTALLLNGPLLTRTISKSKVQVDVTASCAPEVAIAIEQDFRTARDMIHLVHCILRNNSSFIDENAIWWTCNYSSESQ